MIRFYCIFFIYRSFLYLEKIMNITFWNIYAKDLNFHNFLIKHKQTFL